MTELIYQQFKGFLTAGKVPQPPKNEFETLLSKICAVLLFIFGVSLAVAAFKYAGGRIFYRSLIISLLCIGSGMRFYKGISLSWMGLGLLRYWLPTLLFIYIFWVTGIMLHAMIDGVSISKFGFEIGSFIFTMGSLGAIASFKHAQFISKNREPGAKKVFLQFVFVFYGLVWCAFVCGGLVIIFEKQLDKLFN